MLLKIGSRFCLQRGAMKRFFAPAVSSSSGSAARPATTTAPSSSGSVNMMPEQPVEKTTASAPDSSSLPDSSAARPAAKAGGPAELLNLRECKNWLQALPSQEILQNTPLQRLQEEMDLLQRPSSREQRQEIQKLLGNWGVLQKTQGHKRKYDATKADLVAKVVEETHRLKRMRHEFVEPIPDGSDTNASARFSAIQASLQHQSRGRLL